MIRRVLTSGLLALAVLFFAAGCDQVDQVGSTTETDDAGYKRAKELKRQGRNQQALSAFLKVIEKRGDDSAESHLEAGLLYLEHFKNPISAIYHFDRCRELRPNSPTADLVANQIVAAKREFARTLPGDPLANVTAGRLQGDAFAQMDRLQRENDLLKAELANVRLQLASQGPMTRSGSGPVTGDTAKSVAPAGEPLRPADVRPGDLALGARPAADDNIFRPVTEPPAPTPIRPVTSAPPTRPAEPAAASVGIRRHTVVKGDTLFNLAARYYGGNRSRYRDIYAANRSVMKSMEDLRIGTELVIPP